MIRQRDTGSLNPDPVYPKFAHYANMAAAMQHTTDYVDSGGETHATNNLTMATSGGSAIVLDFLARDASNNLINAFNNPQTTFSATATSVQTSASSSCSCRCL